eukprot:2513693-Amphidinium_carterae.1
MGGVEKPQITSNGHHRHQCNVQLNSGTTVIHSSSQSNRSAFIVPEVQGHYANKFIDVILGSQRPQHVITSQQSKSTNQKSTNSTQ